MENARSIAIMARPNSGFLLDVILTRICEYLGFTDLRNFAFLSSANWFAANEQLYKLGFRLPGAFMHTIRHGQIRPMRSLLSFGAKADTKLSVSVPYELLCQKAIGLYSFGHFHKPSGAATNLYTTLETHPEIDDAILAQFPQSVLSPASALSLPSVELSLWPRERLTTLASTPTAGDQNVRRVRATPLHVAALSGHVIIISELVAAGARLDAACQGLCACSPIGPPDSNYYYMEWTPLHLAICHRQVAAAKLLLKLGASVYVCQDYRITALHTAAATGQIELLEYITANGYQTNIEARDRRSAASSPLHYALINGHWDTAALWLISREADVDDVFDVVDEGGRRTMLAQAAEAGRLDEVVQLLRLGADPIRTALWRHATLLQLISRGAGQYRPRQIGFWVDMSRYIPHASSSTRSNYVSPEQDMYRTRLIQLLYPMGTPKEIWQQPGYVPPLVIAVRAGLATVIKALLQAGANPNEPITPVGHNKASDRTPLILLLEDCQHQCWRDGQRWYPREADKTIAKLLVTHGAGVARHRDRAIELLLDMVQSVGGHQKVKSAFQLLLNRLECELDDLGCYAVPSKRYSTVQTEEGPIRWHRRQPSPSEAR
jgi:ankyrin repeat protein